METIARISQRVQSSPLGRTIEFHWQSSVANGPIKRPGPTSDADLDFGYRTFGLPTL
jgi:hypothetical protein